MTEAHLPCNVVVEMLTDYIEGSLDVSTVEQLERHLELCPPCVVFLDQLRSTIEAVGHLPEDTLSDTAMAELEAAFRGYHPNA